MSGRHSNSHRSSKTPSASHGCSHPARELGAMEALKQNEVVYRSKIRSLELELDTLKCRLESLRKAKSTTIIRRDREHVKIASPKLGRRVSTSFASSRLITAATQMISPSPTVCHHGNLPKQIEDLKRQVRQLDKGIHSERGSHNEHYEELAKKYSQEITDLRERSEKEINDMKEIIAKMKETQREENVVCQESKGLLAHLERLNTENRQLSIKLEEMISVNQTLRDSNYVLQSKCETLMDDLSVKEALWTEREDALRAEIRKKWGERYQEWMTRAEKKMEELQQVNTLLQGMLRTPSQS